jgi:hypothetical protein
MSNSPLSPRSQSRPVSQPEDEDEEMLDVDQEEQEAPQASGSFPQATTQQDPRPARENRKDKDLNTFLNSMDKYAPIVLTQ